MISGLSCCSPSVWNSLPEVKVLLWEESREKTVLVTEVCVNYCHIESSGTLAAFLSLAPPAPRCPSHSCARRRRSLIAEVADDEFGDVQLTYDLQSSGAQLLPERQPAELLQTHGSGCGQNTNTVRSVCSVSQWLPTLFVLRDRWIERYCPTAQCLIIA